MKNYPKTATINTTANRAFLSITIAWLATITPCPLLAWTEPRSGIELVRVEGGCFEMGCGPWTDQCLNNEKPLHIVCLEGFWIGKYEITQRQWVNIMKDNPSQFRHGDDLPVDRVSWIKAREFVLRLNKFTGKQFSLPTEAQWEYAARSGGKEERYSGGDMVNELGFHWFNGEKMSHPVGSKLPNGLGIHDMTGNVWEWCRDRYQSDYYAISPRNDPEGPDHSRFRIMRGGSWFHSPWYARSSNRHSSAPGFTHPSVGLRVLLRE